MLRSLRCFDIGCSVVFLVAIVLKVVTIKWASSFCFFGWLQSLILHWELFLNLILIDVTGTATATTTVAAIVRQAVASATFVMEYMTAPATDLAAIMVSYCVIYS